MSETDPPSKSSAPSTIADQAYKSQSPPECTPRFSWKDFFSEVFIPHKGGEVEERLSWGGPGRIPDLARVSSEFPRPWLFARAAMLAAIAYSILGYSFSETQNIHLVPSLIFFGCFAIPCAVLILFFEVNALRDISFIRVVGAFLAGAVGSMCLSLPLFILAEDLGLGWLGASVAGPVEEIAKLAVAFALLRLAPRKTILAGLLVGSAVGAGFAAFESAGYAFRLGLMAYEESFRANLLYELGRIGVAELEASLAAPGDMIQENIFLRGVLSPFTHVIWTALSTAAICRSTRNGKITTRSLTDVAFLRIFALVVALHMYWNSPAFIDLPLLKFSIAAIIGWLAVASMITQGMKQVRALKMAAAVGDESCLMGQNLRSLVGTSKELYYSRGSTVHGPLKLEEILEMEGAGLIDGSVLVSDGGAWHSLNWWKGQGDAEGKHQTVASNFWAWGLVWWPVVIGCLAYFLDEPWFLIGFPLILFLMAGCDRLSNQPRLNKRWPSAWWGSLPPIYLGLRKRAALEGNGKFISGTIITLLVCGWLGFAVWYAVATPEGRTMTLVNEELSRIGLPYQCLGTKLVRKVSENVSIFDATLSDGESNTVKRITVIQTAKGVQIRIED